MDYCRTGVVLNFSGTRILVNNSNNILFDGRIIVGSTDGGQGFIRGQNSADFTLNKIRNLPFQAGS